MRVYVSSTFVDLREHRAAAIKVLRELGHEVVAMEDYVADSAIPLKKVLEDVASSDVYVGIFAWRYGHIPGKSGDDDAPQAPPEGVKLPDAGQYGQRSITEWEYTQAGVAPSPGRERPILAFLLEEGEPWPPHLCDGVQAGTSNAEIQRLRGKLQQERIVSYFRSPEDLGQKVSTAITRVSMSEQVRLNLLDDPQGQTDLLAAANGEQILDSNRSQFVEAVDSVQSTRIIRIDIGTEWWSTRLFLLAFLLQRLTNVRVILVENSSAANTAVSNPPNDLDKDGGTARFCALLSTETVQRVLPPLHPPLVKFQQSVGERSNWSPDLKTEADELLGVWEEVLPRHSVPNAQTQSESTVQKRVTSANLERWFGDAMFAQALWIPDLTSATPLDLVRLLDYPNDFVPVTTETLNARADSSPMRSNIVVDKQALNAQLARSYLTDLLNRAGIPT